MTKITYNIKGTDKEAFVLQVRILRPELNLRTIEVLYYIWKFPNFQEELIKQKLYKNRQSVDTTISNMTDSELLLATKTGNRVVRQVHPTILKHIKSGPIQITLNVDTN